MNRKYFSIAGLTFSIDTELELNFGIAEDYFLYKGNSEPDAEFIISTDEITEYGDKIHSTDIFSVYEKDDTYMTVFRNSSGDFVLSRKKREPFKGVLSGNRKDMEIQQKLLVQGFLGLEVPMLFSDTFLLHSSLISVNGNGLIFSGPSGIGKSTQAGLWEEYKGAEILNGDRACVKVAGEKTVAYGSVFAGSSFIYRNESVPVKAIVILGQSDNNEIEKLSPSKAFYHLYNQSLNHVWDEEYVQKLVSLIEKTIAVVPVYMLNCRKDKSAVDLLYSEIFKDT